jgi:hypothetical protein
VTFKQVPAAAGSCTEVGDLGEAAAGQSVVLFGTVLHAVSFFGLSYQIKLEDATRDDGESGKAERVYAVCAVLGVRERAVLAAEGFQPY